MKRAKHSLSHYKLQTFDMGELVPIGCYEVLPGDTVQQNTSALIRVSPLLTPVMHPISVRIHHWFVPHRLVWTGWEDFITGGSDGLGDGVGAFPTIDSGAGFAAGGLMDYLGVPPSVDVNEVSALPVRSYNLIWNEYYRDQDLNTARVVPTASGNDTTSPLTLALSCWEKDYFTSARPWTQRGPAVTMPLGSTAPVKGTGSQAITFRDSADSANRVMRMTSGSTTVTFASNPGVNSDVYLSESGAESGMIADLAAATAANVNDVRRAFALQRYAEARAIYGARYTEYLRYLGVRSKDARLQRPEYLGGGKQTISFSEVLQTGPEAAGGGVATLKGHGIAAMRSRRYRRFFEEHGLVLSLMSVRPRAMYTSGLQRMFNRRTKEDFHQPELEQIGQQEIKNKEVRANHGTPEGTWGYQDRYSEYRHLPSEVAAEFRSTLNMWHLARAFASDQALNSAFVECLPSKRIHAIQTADVMWAMVSHSIQARRRVRRSSQNRVL